MYPYPSGALHIGHWYIVTPTDAIARYQRMHGDNVFLPIGFDAFGLPAENAAIKGGFHPARVDDGQHRGDAPPVPLDGRHLRLEQRGRDLRPRLLPLEPVAVHADAGARPGVSLRLARGLVPQRRHPGPGAGRGRPTGCAGAAARRSRSASCRSGTCGPPNYADELLDFAGIDWPEPVQIMQTNWIGRSTGAEIVFETAASPHHAGGEELRVFTTRPDTLFGATFMVLAPEHPLVADADGPRQARRGGGLRRRCRRPRRRSTACPPTARRPASRSAPTRSTPSNGKRIPIFIADYVLATYGTGAIMAVPAHDERDFAFAKKFGLPIVKVVMPKGARSRTRS